MAKDTQTTAPVQPEISESEQITIRKEKLARMQAAGNDPFLQTTFPVNAWSGEIVESFTDPEEGEEPRQVYCRPHYQLARYG